MSGAGRSEIYGSNRSRQMKEKKERTQRKGKARKCANDRQSARLLATLKSLEDRVRFTDLMEKHIKIFTFHEFTLGKKYIIDTHISSSLA